MQKWSRHMKEASSRTTGKWPCAGIDRCTCRRMSVSISASRVYFGIARTTFTATAAPSFWSLISTTRPNVPFPSCLTTVYRPSPNTSPGRSM
jgi:hypothetical protein